VLLIEVGDLSLPVFQGTKQQRLFSAIQQKITAGLWPIGGRLPSSRELCRELGLSRNTVVLTYEQLAAEGYIESRRGSGFYVMVTLPEHYLSVHDVSHGLDLHQNVRQVSVVVPYLNPNAPFAPGVPDLAKFPDKKWLKLLQRHSDREVLLGNHDLQGDRALRMALSDYLASSRSVHCVASRIIITSGAQQALAIALLATLNRGESVLIEQPGYTQMRKVISLFGFCAEPVQVQEQVGLNIDAVLASSAKALYVTPSNQYPLGTTLNIEQRAQLIEWAHLKQRWLIEDDYDSEFQFAHQPYTSMQGLAAQMGQDQRVIYIGSLSKVMFNGLRLGYMVVPESLVARCLEIKDAMSGDTPTHTQAALADFILEGDLLRHIRKMRRLYRAKQQAVVEAVTRYFNQSVEVISQAAGLHVTLKWYAGIDEQSWVCRAQEEGIIIRPLSYYEAIGTPRDWSGIVLGFGNTTLEDIDPLIETLADLFFA
jgi:GntR family transcriptional regulator/MocR family aminotransferase